MTTTRNITTLQSAAFALMLKVDLSDAEVRALEKRIADHRAAETEAKRAKVPPIKLTFVELTPAKPERPKALDCMSDLIRLLDFHGLKVPYYNYHFKDFETLVVTVPSANFYEFVRDIRELKSTIIAKYIVVETRERNAFGGPIDTQRWPPAAKTVVTPKTVPAPMPLDRVKPSSISTIVDLKKLMAFYGITNWTIEEGYKGFMPLVHVKVPDLYVYQVCKDVNALMSPTIEKLVSGNGSYVPFPEKINHREDLRQLAYAYGFHEYNIRHIAGNIHRSSYYVFQVPVDFYTAVSKYVREYRNPYFGCEVGIT